MEERDPRGIPPLPPAHVARPRLTSLLDANAAQCMILNAPAGYGKTSLAAEWLRTRDSVAWYAATSESADVAALSAGIADAMSSVVPGAAERLRARLLVASGPDEAVQPLAEILSEDIAGWPDEAVLVLDDYHLVMESGAAERFVDCILTLNPSLRVLIATRQRPTWASARRLLAGDVAELLADVLAMTDAEAGAVLTERPTAAVAELVERAEGWPAVIGLAAVAGSSSLPGIRLSDDLFRYFAEEVFRAADRDVRDLVLLAAIPRTLTVEIASGPLGIESAGRRLDHLRALGLASSSTEGVRIHPLLRDFLRHKLRADAPERFAELVRRILEFARDRRLWDEAYEAASTLGEPRTAADVAGEAGPDLLSEGRTETLQRGSRGAVQR